jgi:hypothetical protein
MIDEHSFDNSYGKGAFVRLRRMIEERTLTFAQIGYEFGINKQYVSKLAQLFGINGRQRQRERTNSHPLRVENRRQEYPPTTRQVLDELKRRGIPVAPHYTMRRQRHAVYKNLTMVLVNGVPCKIGCRNKRKGARFATFHVTKETRKAEAMVCGIRHGAKFRLYVIPVSELKNLKRINIPATGAYILSVRNRKRDWTRFENAWRFLRDGSPKHVSYTTRGG